MGPKIWVILAESHREFWLARLVVLTVTGQNSSTYVFMLHKHNQTDRYLVLITILACIMYYTSITVVAAALLCYVARKHTITRSSNMASLASSCFNRNLYHYIQRNFTLLIIHFYLLL